MTPYYLEWHDDVYGKDRRLGANSYLLVHPFGFSGNRGKLASRPQEATAFVGAVAAQRPSKRALEVLPTKGEFRLFRADHKGPIATLTDFRVRALWTPCSLDMSRAIVGMRADKVPTTRIQATPVPCVYDKFPADNTDENAYWGAVVKTPEGTLLEASLSVPMYDWQRGYLREYFALGPANSNDVGASLVEWLIGRGEVRTDKVPVESDNEGDLPKLADALPPLTIHDVVHDRENTLFGDGGGHAQVNEETTGAVFMAGGTFGSAWWRDFAEFIRWVVTNKGEDSMTTVLKQIPRTMLGQSVRETCEDAVYADEDLGASDFEGIMVWDLDPRSRGDRITPVHR